MPSHDDHHDALPGYDPRQILVTGCAECEARGKDIAIAIAHLDAERMERAWRRAYDNWASHGDGYDATGPISEAEYPLLHALWTLQVQLERRGWPLGELPGVYAR